MKERLVMTNDEKFVHNVLGDNGNFTKFAMNEQNIDKMIENEKKEKFNNQFDKHAEELEQQKKAIEEAQEKIQENISKIEIKPLFNRILVKPFAANPFQRMKIEHGIITDLGGLNPEIHKNMETGEWEERDQMIIVATVVDAGPECKYVQPGDTVFYMKNLPTPVPFFRQGLWTIKEENLIAVVNEGLEERFNGRK